MSIDWEVSPEGQLIPVTYNDEGEKVYPAWAPQPGSQEAFLTCQATEVLYSGSRGGGKTDTLLMDFAQDVGVGWGADWRGILFRQSHPQLQDIIAKTKKWYRLMFPGAKYNEAKSTWTFPDGEELLLRHANKTGDYYNHHGSSYPWIGWEELTTWPDDQLYRLMFSVSRSARKGMPKKIRSTTNPYGCVPYGKVLTSSRGWVQIQDIQVGEQVLSVGKDGIARDVAVSAVIEKEYSGDIVYRDGAGLSMAFTPDHRFPHLNTDRSSFAIKPFHDLPGQAVLKRTCDGWHGDHVRDICGFDAGDFMEFAGWFLSEGCVVRAKGKQVGNALQIAQMKPDTRVVIEQLLIRMEVHYRKDFQSFTVTDRSLSDYFNRQGYSYEKYIPQELLRLSTPLLSRLYESLMLGDGHDKSYFTTSPLLAEGVEELSVKLGKSVYTHQCLPRDRTRERYSVHSTDRHTIQLHTGNHLYNVTTQCGSVNVDKRSFLGKVYCLTVPDTETFFIKQDGCVWLSGNSGHNWVKDRFRLPVPEGKILGPTIVEHGISRVAIHSRLTENKVLLTVDPNYINKIRQSARNDSERAAWLHGSWDITSGGMFDDLWKPGVHIVNEFQLHMIPSGWRIDRSFDWGSSRPFSVGWWAESNGEPVEYNGVTYGNVPGDLFRIREWYGYTGTRNEGLRMLAEDIAIKIREMQIEWGIDERVKAGPADASIFDLENGRSVSVDMRKQGVRWTKADKRPGSRKQGWEQVRRMLVGSMPPEEGPRENPGLFVFPCCDQFIITVPPLPRSERDPDDADTDAEDHCFTPDTLVQTQAGAVRMDQLDPKLHQVVAPDGTWADFVSPRVTRQQADLIEVAFSDGSVVRCTPDHQFCTPPGWSAAKEGLLVMNNSGPSLAIVRVDALPQKSDVMCITVPGHGAFCLANGVIVANCADEVRYRIRRRHVETKQRAF